MPVHLALCVGNIALTYEYEHFVLTFVQC